MNIRLENRVRIRLDGEDVQWLINHDSCSKDFVFENIQIIGVDIFVAEDSYSDMSVPDKRLKVTISRTDFAKMTSPSHRKEGINIGKVNVQFDVSPSPRLAFKGFPIVLMFLTHASAYYLTFNCMLRRIPGRISVYSLGIFW